MVELWDLLDEEGNPTGQVMQRGEPVKKGNYYLVVHIWILNQRKEYLVQKRSLLKKWKPDFWAVTGGSALMGETSLQAALRETEEEVGIKLQPDQLKHLERIKRVESFMDIWVAYVTDEQTAAITLNEEVTEVNWHTAGEIEEMIELGLFIDYWREEFYKTELQNIE